MKPLAIIGLDPGTTAAYVIVDLKGTILASSAAKELPLSQIISSIMTHCQPVIVATDKAKTPSLVEEFSRKIGAIIVAPEEDLLREEKRLSIEEAKLLGLEKLKTNHEYDALAAALFAYKKYLPRLQKIERYIEQERLYEQRNAF